MRYCLELPYSSVRHFPEGTYHRQMATWYGRTEMEAMRTVQQAWYMFSYLEMSKWKGPELRFFRWLNERSEEKPTNRANELIALLWGASWWVLKMLRGRDDD